LAVGRLGLGKNFGVGKYIKLMFGQNSIKELTYSNILINNLPFHTIVHEEKV
jgi:hypothetical protein